MALVLTLNTGNDIYIGPDQLVVKEVVDDYEAVVIYKNVPITVKDGKWTKLDELRAVRVSEHRPTTKSPNTIRLEVDAPNDLVLRGSLYRRQRQTTQ